MGTQPLPQKGRSPTQFSAHVYCGETAAWIKMPLGTEVDLGLRDILFGVDSATPRKKGTHPHPIFGPCLLWTNGWIDEDAALPAWYGSRPRPRPHCTRRAPSFRERGTAAPLFLAHVYCGHGRPSQPLLSYCSPSNVSAMLNLCFFRLSTKTISSLLLIFRERLLGSPI